MLKTIKQNKGHFALISLTLVFFIAIIAYGGRLLFEMEMETQHAGAISHLQHEIETARDYFSRYQQDIDFLKNLPDMDDFIESGFSSNDAKEHITEAFYYFATTHTSYYQIRIINDEGSEVLRVDNINGSPITIVPESQLQYKGGRDYFIDTMCLGKDMLYVSDVDLNVERGLVEYPYVPVVRIATPLFDSEGANQGMIIINTYISKLLSLLSKDVFFQNDQGFNISLRDDGTIDYSKAEFRFRGKEGEVIVSDTETIHFSYVDISEGKDIYMVSRHHHDSLKTSMFKEALMSIVAMILFFSVVLVISYTSIVRFKELSNVQKAIIFSLVNLAEWRDPATGSHLERTRNYCVLLAKTLRMDLKYHDVISEQFIEDIYDGAPLHDIGKVGIRDNILLKKARFSAEEREAIQKHVLIGKDIHMDILEQIKTGESFLMVSHNISAYHHEKYDGSGYPDGLRGEEIPIEARLFAICDVYDALRMERPYKQGYSHEKAMEIITADRGKHFDPDVVDAFLQCAEEFHEIHESFSIFDEIYGTHFKVRSRDAMKFRWSEKFTTGVDDIDRFQKELIGMINQLFFATVQGNGKAEARELIGPLTALVERLFRAAEMTAQEYGCPEYTKLTEKHEIYMDSFASLNAVFQEHGTSSDIVIHLNSLLVDLFVHHLNKNYAQIRSSTSSPKGCL